MVIQTIRKESQPLEIIAQTRRALPAVQGTAGILVSPTSSLAVTETFGDQPGHPLHHGRRRTKDNFANSAH